jgi:release factor glutamine methyltransferase
MSTVKQVLKVANQKLYGKTKTPALDAEILLALTLKKPKEFLYIHPEYLLTKKQISSFQFLISQRLKGKPIAYLTGHQEFYGLDFLVNKHVLIPRPESELIIEEVVKIANCELRTANCYLADIGTGSGCLAITLAKLLPQVKIYASDISVEALKTAKKNAEVHRVKINFRKGNLLRPFIHKKIDLLTANLPYGWLEWKNNTLVETKGLKFEPSQALFTKEKGLKLYRQLFEQIVTRKQKLKLIFLEFDPRQTADFKKLIKKYLPQYKMEIKKDLACRDRIIILKYK